jgi:hypothetical protein
VVVCIFGLTGCGPAYNGVAKDRATAISLAKKYCGKYFNPLHTSAAARLYKDTWIVSVIDARDWAFAIIDAKTGRPLECRAGTGRF